MRLRTHASARTGTHHVRRPLLVVLAAALSLSIGVGMVAATASLAAAASATQVAGYQTLWGTEPDAAVAAARDSKDVELGTVFTSDVDGWVSGVRYYKSSGDTGTHTGTLWSATGAKLATATFTDESRSGWQTVTFASPVRVTAEQKYVVSYSSNGYYSYTHDFRGQSEAENLSVPRGSSGVYAYGETSRVPTSTHRSSQYWVDPLFSTSKSGSGVVTPTATPSPSLSTAPPLTPGPKPSLSPIPSPSPTVTVSPSPTASPTPSASPTASPRPTASPSPTASPTPSASPRPTASPSPTASPTPSPTPSPSPSDFPGAGNTGVPAGTTLTAYTGPSRITTPGTVIDSKIITTPIVITAGAHDVTIKNSVIRASAFFLVLNDEGARNLQIIDSELDGLDNTGNDAAVGGRNYTLTRVNIHSTMDGLKIGDNVTVQDSYIHDLVTTRDSHNDGIQSLGSTNVVIRHNTILVPGGSTSAIILSTGSASAMRNILIDGNLLGGGAYTVYGGYQAGVDVLSRVSDITISNNHITTTINPKGGVYGPFASVDRPAVTLVGNVWHDGPSAGRAAS